MEVTTDRHHKEFGSTQVSLDFAQAHAAAIMAASPVSYVRDAKLRGSLFTSGESNDDDDDDDRLISGVDSGFFVGHAEPFKALAWLREHKLWSLGGDLPDGYEFLLVLEAPRRRRMLSPSSERR